MKVLVLEPHPDDLEIGCGGFVARARNQGVEVLRVVMCFGTYERQDGVLLNHETRRLDLERSNDRLGVDYWFLGLPDNQVTLDLYPKAIQALDSLIDGFQPDEVLVPLPSSNQDHKACWEISTALMRYRLGGWNPKRWYAYGSPDLGAEFVPTAGLTYVAVSCEEQQRRIEAMACHTTQNLEDRRNSHGLWAVDLWAKQNGLKCGADYADVLYLLKEVVW